MLLNAVFVIKLIYVDVLTAIRENKVIALKPVQTKYLMGQMKSGDFE